MKTQIFVDSLSLEIPIEERMILTIRALFKEGEFNPSSIASKLWYLGFKDGRFTDIRKNVEHQYRLYCQEQAEMKKI